MSISYSETLRARVDPMFKAAVERAAESERVKPSEWVRSALREKLSASDSDERRAS